MRICLVARHNGHATISSTGAAKSTTLYLAAVVVSGVTTFADMRHALAWIRASFSAKPISRTPALHLHHTCTSMCAAWHTLHASCSQQLARSCTASVALCITLLSSGATTFSLHSVSNRQFCFRFMWQSKQAGLVTGAMRLALYICFCAVMLLHPVTVNPAL